MSELPWEDNLLERKVESDLKDLLKTLVAFANSVRPGHVATILIGERDDGTVQGVKNPDQIQKKVRSECEKIYPPIVWKSRVYEQDSKHCVRVEIEYDGDTPHFGGPAWVRKGSETIKATDEVFQRLIDTRSGKVRLLTEWLGKEVTYVQRPLSGGYTQGAKRFLQEVNAFYLTLEDRLQERESFPLPRISMSYDHKEDRPMIVWEK